MKQTLLKTMVLTLALLGGASSVWAGDFIDDASSITITHNSVTIENAVSEVDGKKIISFTTTKASSDACVEFNFTSRTITPGQIFGVVEYSSNALANKCRFRNLTLDGTSYDDGTQGDYWSTTLASGNTLVICSMFSKNTISTAATFFKNNSGETSFALTYAKAYFGNNTSGATVTVKRMGLYTLAEIISLYSSDLVTKNWQINGALRLLNDAGVNGQTNTNSSNGFIELGNSGTNITDVTTAKLAMKAVDPANLNSNYTTIDGRYLKPTDITPEDIFSSMTNSQKLLLDCVYMHTVPTMHTNFDYHSANQFYQYIDGTDPSTISATHNSGQNWAVYTRNLKAGYNSILIPMKYLSYYDSSNLKFYKRSGFSENTVTFTTDTPTSSSNDYSVVPMIVYAPTDGLYTLVGRDGGRSDKYSAGYQAQEFGTSTAVYFVGSFVDKVPDGDYAAGTNCVNYGITSDGTDFAKMGNSTKTTYYRAFISDKRSGVNQAPLRSVVYDEKGTTGISMLHEVVLDENAPVYNLNGVRMQGDNLPRGIYVRNGKKFIVK